MARLISTLLLALLASAARGQWGAPITWPPSTATTSPAQATTAQPSAPAPGQMTPQMTPQVTPQGAPQPSTPIFPAPGTSAQPGAPASGSVPAPFPSAAPAPASPTSMAPPAPGAQPFDYSVNLKSEVFGARMFTGAFAQSAASIFNPDHVVAVGDQLQVKLWGAYQFDALLSVDAQGNIFVPQVGPVRVAGVPNRDLHKVLEGAIRRVFRANVFSYISLAAAQPVRVFVTGFVHRPGMYQGTSTDSVLRFLDQAGGIDPNRGSFLDVQVLRGALVRATFNLYDFLLGGKLPSVQLGDGDVVMVAPRKSTFLVAGLAENANRFEFTGESIELAHLAALARPLPTATHVRVTRNTGTVLNTEYYPLSAVGSVRLENGDQIEFTSDKRPGTISVRVEGEHVSPQEYVLPYGSRLADVVKQVKFTERSDTANVQLFRLSTRERQAALLQQSLRNLEQAVLTARSGTAEEAQLRKAEADLILNWTARARNIVPLGQVVIAQSNQRDELLLENGDVLRVPVKDGLVQVQGEVVVPTAVAYDARLGILDYIKRAGGYSQNADTSRVLIAHRDGSFSEARDGDGIRPGDDILVLPRVDNKSRQFWKDITQIIFQIAVSAKVILGL